MLTFFASNLNSNLSGDFIFRGRVFSRQVGGCDNYFADHAGHSVTTLPWPSNHKNYHLVEVIITVPSFKSTIVTPLVPNIKGKLVINDYFSD